MSPDEAARQIRHLVGDTEFKRDQETAYSATDLLEDLSHRLVSLADVLEGGPEDDEAYVPAYPLTDWDTLQAGHWV